VRQLFAVLIACATLSTTTGLAHAGACVDQIATFEQAPQLGHPPTWEALQQAQTYSQLMLSADLARAETLDAQGNEERCLLAARHAKLELEHRVGTMGLAAPQSHALEIRDRIINGSL
jgi:hypothetical protein